MRVDSMVIDGAKVALLCVKIEVLYFSRVSVLETKWVEGIGDTITFSITPLKIQDIQEISEFRMGEIYKECIASIRDSLSEIGAIDGYETNGIPSDDSKSVSWTFTQNGSRVSACWEDGMAAFLPRLRKESPITWELRHRAWKRICTSAMNYYEKHNNYSLEEKEAILNRVVAETGEQTQTI